MYDLKMPAAVCPLVLVIEFWQKMRGKLVLRCFWKKRIILNFRNSVGSADAGAAVAANASLPVAGRGMRCRD